MLHPGKKLFSGTGEANRRMKGTGLFCLAKKAAAGEICSRPGVDFEAVN
jgi:hypothetical protein